MSRYDHDGDFERVEGGPNIEGFAFILAAQAARQRYIDAQGKWQRRGRPTTAATIASRNEQPR